MKASSSRAARYAVAWAVWLLVGAFAFGIPSLIGNKGTLVAAFAAASETAKAMVGLWVLDSVALGAPVFAALGRGAQQGAPADRPTSGGTAA